MFNELNNLRLFFEEPSREFNVREVARLLKLSPATASKKLKELEKLGMVKGRQERMLILYKANLESQAYLDIKSYYTIRIIRESGLLESLNKFYLKPTIVLYGSACFGLDTETSDVDLLVISEKTKDFPDTAKFQQKLKRKIQILVVADIKELKNDHLINNVLNGITLQGMIKWISMNALGKG
jgi:predicted nucleotidyltransferase